MFLTKKKKCILIFNYRSVFAPSITIQLSGLIDENEYMAFGVSKPQGQSQMIGADVAVAFIDGYLGIVDDYNITAKAPCGGVLGLNKGVCKDEVTGKTRKSFNY
jgi:hypothetical protein